MDGNSIKRRSGRAAFGLCALLLVLFTALPQAPGGESGSKNPQAAKREPEKSVFGVNKNDPIVITSDRMDLDQKKNTITYFGRVVAQQGGMTLRSQILTAYYDSELRGLREVVAEGQVQVTQGDRVATGTKAVFSDKEQTITLTGNPVVRQGNSQVSGSRIVFFMEQDRAVVEGGEQRVKATIFPGELQQRDEAKGYSGKSR